MALQIGHRVSVDLDFFSNDYIGKELFQLVKRSFPGKKIKPSVNTPDELTVFIDNAKVTFLRYPFPPLERLESFKGVRMLNPREIAASKAYALGRRGSYKDYFDLYFTIKECISISEIIKLAEKKYKEEFNSRLFLEQLVYSKDIESADISFLRSPVAREEVERFFSEKVKNLEI